MQFGALSSSTLSLADGAAGTLDTLRIMRGLVQRYKKDVPTIKSTALALVADLPPKSYYREADAVFRFVRDGIRYVRDTTGQENLVVPTTLLQMRQGDCGSKSVLLAALLESIGHPTRFVAIGNAPQEFSHVYVETKVANNWIPLESTMQWESGRAPEGYAYQMVMPN